MPDRPIHPCATSQAASSGCPFGLGGDSNRAARVDLVTCLLHEPGIVPVDGDQVSRMLDADGIAVSVTPGSAYHRAFQNGSDGVVLTGGDFYVRVQEPVIFPCEHALDGREEMNPLEREYPLGRVLDLEAAFGGYQSPEGRVAACGFRIGSRVGFETLRIEYAVDIHRSLPAYHSQEVVRVQFPSDDYLLQRVDPDGAFDCLPLRLGIRVSWYQSADRSQPVEGEISAGKHHDDGDCCHQELASLELQRPDVVRGAAV